MAPVLLGAGPAAALTDLELLGKNVFFDKQLSTPRGKQSCASCHEPAVGFVLPLSKVNETTVGAPGAKPGEQGSRKVPTNAYASFSPEFRVDLGIFGTNRRGGNFWDGRAEGCGKPGGATDGPDCQIGNGNVSETITPEDLPEDPNNPGAGLHEAFLGPTADQALNPTARPGPEQNTREKTVCQMVRTAKYKALYEAAWGEPIDCSQQGDPPAYHISFKRLAVAVAAWQASPDVNSFSSLRDECIQGGDVFPCGNLSDKANLGHDIFYGRNDTGQNRPVPDANPFAPGDQPGPLNALCATCHQGVPAGDPADPAGNGAHQLYTDFGYHCLGTPFNAQIPTTEFRDDEGLAGHTGIGGHAGCFKTPTLRNVAQNKLGITKNYFHNGYFKTLEQVVHFYNTSQIKPDCAAAPINIPDATADEAIANDCWPQGEFPSQAGPLVGNLGLTPAEEEAVVAYLKTLSDKSIPKAPSTVKK